MANYGGFPSIDFSWLGELPGIAQQTSDAAKLRAARDSLSNLDPRDPKTLEIAAGRLISAGDLEGGAKLYGLATARRGVDQRSAADEAYKSILPLLLGNKTQVPQSVAGGTFTYEPTDTGAAPETPASPPPTTPPGSAPMTLQPQPLMPFPTSALPPPPPVPPTAPGNINIPPQGPEAAQIAAALAPPSGPLPPPQAPPPIALAGPPPTPDTGPPVPPIAPPVAPVAPPPGFNPNFFQPPIDTTAVPGAVPPAPKTVQLPSTLYNPADLTKSLDSVRNQILALGAAGKGGTQASQMLEAQFHNLLRVGNASESERNYQLDQLQNEKLGLPRQTRQDWENLNKDYPARAADFRKAFNEDYRTPMLKGQQLIPQLETMKHIMDNPAYNSGPGTELFNGAVATLNGAVNGLRRLGVPEEYLPDLSTLKDPARMADAYTALVHSAVITSLGGLGARSTSNADVKYQAQTWGDLQKTKEGNMLIAEYQLERAKQAVAAGEVAANYAQKYGETRGTVIGLDKAVRTYINDNPILGPDSPLRQRMDEQLKKTDPRTGAAYEPIIEKGKAAVAAGPTTAKDFVQTITGFGPGGPDIGTPQQFKPPQSTSDLLDLNNANIAARYFGSKAKEYIDTLFGSGGAVPAPVPPGTRTAPVAATAPAPTPQESKYPPAPKVIPRGSRPLLDEQGKKVWELPDGSFTQRD